MECQVKTVRLLDPGSGIDRPQHRRLLGDDRPDAVAPNVSTGAEMRKHIVCGPPIKDGDGMQARWRQTGGQRVDAPRVFCQQGQNLLNPAAHAPSSLRTDDEPSEPSAPLFPSIPSLITPTRRQARS